jgi:choline dehydrogenase-like flavoprotein
VANSSDAVGRYFMEHPHYYRSAAIVVPDAVDVGFYERFEADTRATDEDPEQRVRVVGVLSLSAEAREREGLPTFLAQLGPSDAAIEQERGRTGRIGPLGAAELLAGRATPGLLNLTCRVEQTPIPDSRITLRSERDALGLPVLDLHWAIRPEDDRNLLRALELLGIEVARAGLGRLWIPTSGDAFDGTPKGGCHHMGTTRMGDDPERAVVDADCRSFDLDNLYVAGCSVFPTGGASNPTLTITALAHRLADHLKESP